MVEAYAKNNPVKRSHLFGKESCPHCKRAKAYLEKEGIQYTYHDVVSSPRDLYEMISRVKPRIDPKTPITVPQIWLGGHYIGGADQLQEFLEKQEDKNRVHQS